MKKEDIKRNLKKYYDTHVEQRDNAKTQNWKMNERAQFLHYLQKNQCATLLELGAGTGKDSLFFKNNGLAVTAIDLSENHIEKCRAKGLNALCLDIYHIDKKFHKDQFDAIYSLNALLHIPKKDLQDIFGKIKKVLKKEGLFYLGVYGGQNKEKEFRQDDGIHKRFFSFHEYNDYLHIVKKLFKVEYSRILHKNTNLEFHSFILRNSDPC
jgi:cyclopropane fatty-acyl-phospholipid synthase-like methyltransferase